MLFWLLNGMTRNYVPYFPQRKLRTVNQSLLQKTASLSLLLKSIHLQITFCHNKQKYLAISPNKPFFSSPYHFLVRTPCLTPSALYRTKTKNVEDWVTADDTFAQLNRSNSGICRFFSFAEKSTKVSTLELWKAEVDS